MATISIYRSNLGKINENPTHACVNLVSTNMC